MDASWAENTKNASWPGRLNIVHFQPRRMAALSGKREQASGIGRAGISHFQQILPPQLSHTLGNGCHKGRFISLAAPGDWGKERAIGLNKKSVLRYVFGAVMRVDSFLEGDRATETDVKAKLEERCHF